MRRPWGEQRESCRPSRCAAVDVICYIVHTLTFIIEVLCNMPMYGKLCQGIITLGYYIHKAHHIRIFWGPEM